ncbi:hypothetical protein BHM03_00017149 [Ensete ventricosum]|nr:hypothetical protein BHM03_00017149 [Ensete ventricosum]
MASTRSTRTWWRPARSKKTIEHPRSNIIMQRKYGPQLTMVVLIPFFQQLTDINVIMFYAPVSFKTVGSGDDASLPPSPHVRCDQFAVTPCTALYGWYIPVRQGTGTRTVLYQVVQI